MRLTPMIGFLFAATLPAHAASPLPLPFPLDADLGGVKSPYTETLLKLAQTFRAQGWQGPAPATLALGCLETPGNNLYIGVRQELLISAPLDQVVAVIEDFDHYQELFPGYEKVQLTSRESNRRETAWEQKIPLPFVSNIKYKMSYLIDAPASAAPARRIYRYQLHEAGKIKASDGVILLQQNGARETWYREYDFFDADWGIAKLAGRTRIWEDSVKGLALSDWAIKLKAENPAWTPNHARDESKDRLAPGSVKKCAEQKQPIKGQ